MEPDAVLVSNTREWLLRAKEDLDNAQHDRMATPPFIRDSLFHCQQVVEKGRKALLTWHDSAFRKTHNLEELGELCTRIDGTLAPAMGIHRTCAEIHPHHPRKAAASYYRLR